MMVKQIYWVASDKSLYLFHRGFVWMHERIGYLCFVLHGHESCYNPPCYNPPCYVICWSSCCYSDPAFEVSTQDHRFTRGHTHGLRFGTRYLLALMTADQVFGSSVLGALRDGMKLLNSYLWDREFVFWPCSFGGLSPFLPIMLFSRNKRCSELHWAVIQWEGAVEDVLEDQGQVGTGLWRCLCSWQEGVGTRWFLRYLPTQTIPQFRGSLLWCFLESSVWVLWHTQRPEPEEQSWKPLEVGSAVGQDSSSTELAMSLPSHCCPAASHSSSPMAWRACSMCSNTRSISRMGFVPPGWKRSLLWI